MTGNTSTIRVGLIIGSTRVGRVAPQVADFVLDAIKAGDPANAAASLRAGTVVDLVDLKDFNLPIFDEPGIPKRIESPEDYKNEHTRVWARHIASYDAFVFLSAQRNWGIPAELKNAIDFLFHEWEGKPAMIITYGGHGGEKAAGHIRTVIGAFGMRVLEKQVSMAFPSHEYLEKAFKGEDLRLDARNDTGPWAEHRSKIADIFWQDMIDDILVSNSSSLTRSRN